MEMSSTSRNFRLRLPEELYNELRSAAHEAGQPATRLAQELLQVGFDEWRRTRRRQQIAKYARQVAGNAHDLDADLECGIADCGRIR
jgi:hypothetical protein